MDLRQRMKLLTGAVCLGLAAAGARATERLTVGGLGEPAFADRETSATFALPQANERNWRLTLSPGAMTASNRVDAVFGIDADSDSVLSPDETLAVIGFERGSWFILGGENLEQRWTAAASPAGGPLVFDVRFSGEGAMRGFTFRDKGGAVSFAELPPMAAFLNPAQWRTMRLTARGGDARTEMFQVSVFPSGSTFRLK